MIVCPLPKTVVKQNERTMTVEQKPVAFGA